MCWHWIRPQKLCSSLLVERPEPEKFKKIIGSPLSFMLLHYSHVQYQKWKTATPTDSNCYRQLHTQTLTEAHKMLYEHTTKPTSTHSHSTAGNGLTKLNKWNHCDLNERQSRSDIQKCTILSPSFHQFISPPSVSFGLCLCWGHPQIPPFLFVCSPLMSLFSHLHFATHPFP